MSTIKSESPLQHLQARPPYPGGVSTELPLDEMDETEFEEFCFELMREVGFKKLDWRKGTGLNASPADSGRDIVGYLDREDVDGSTHLETWFVDCKHYKRGVPPEKVQGLLAWAQAERPHVALVIASNYLSNPCKDNPTAYERNNRPPFRIRWWERATLERMAEDKGGFLERLFRPGLRTQEELLEEEQRFFDYVWYNRKFSVEAGIADGSRPVPPDIVAGMRRGMKEVEERYGVEALGPWTDFEWGMINGKLSALRWVMGDEWDFLDT
jgi:hypothetical protein